MHLVKGFHICLAISHLNEHNLAGILVESSDADFARNATSFEDGDNVGRILVDGGDGSLGATVRRCRTGKWHGAVGKGATRGKAVMNCHVPRTYSPPALFSSLSFQ